MIFRESEAVCHVVGAGDWDPALFCPKEGDRILAADGGYRALQSAGFRPHLFLGDGDSLGYVPQEVPATVLPRVKDDTDTVAACREGLSLGFRLFRLYGALGGSRLSHSLANLQTLSFLADHGARGILMDTACRITLLTPGVWEEDLSGGHLSLFAAEGDCLLSLSGTRYDGERLRLSPRFPLGVSNEGGRDTRITLHEGRCLLVWEPFTPPKA